MKGQFDPHAALRELVRDQVQDRFDIAIDYHADWYYRGSRIDRIELVRLFATVLHRDAEGRFWLMTPVERGMIDVKDAPFVIGAATFADVVTFEDNLGRVHELEHEGQLVLRSRPDGRGDVPYLALGHGLEARLRPSVFYELVDAAIEREGQMGIFSAGQFHNLGAAT